MRPIYVQIEVLEIERADIGWAKSFFPSIFSFFFFFFLFFTRQWFFGPATYRTSSPLLETSYRSFQAAYPRSFSRRCTKIRVVQPKLARLSLAAVQQRLNLTQFAAVTSFTDHQRHELNGLILFQEMTSHDNESLSWHFFQHVPSITI